MPDMLCLYSVLAGHEVGKQQAGYPPVVSCRRHEGAVNIPGVAPCEAVTAATVNFIQHVEQNVVMEYPSAAGHMSMRLSPRGNVHPAPGVPL